MESQLRQVRHTYFYLYVPASEDKDTISTGRPPEDDLHCIGMGIFLHGGDGLVHVSGDAVEG